MRGYKFSYDGLNRLTTAVYGEREDMSNHPNRYDEYVLEYTANGAIKHMQRWGKKNDGVYGKIDNLEITHTGNQLSTVTDDALPVLYDGKYDFKDNTVSVTGAEYHYNGNGSLVSDANKGIANIDYDNNNMPRRIQFTNGNVTEYIYSAGGEKLRTIHRTAVANVTVPVGSTLPLTKANTLSVDSTDYIGNFEIGSGLWYKYYFYGGYCRIFSGKTNARGRRILPPPPSQMVTFHYYTQDHLGNNRAVVNENGTLEQVTHYYPFGGVYGNAGLNASAQQYKYNGKELDRMHGLDWYDYGARSYDAVVPMWTSVDPLCEKNYYISPYVYCGNDPMNAFDPDGRKFINFDAQGNYTGTTQDKWWHNLFVGTKGRVLDGSGNVSQKFKFADAKNDVKDIQRGVIKRIEFVKEGDVRGMLSKAGAFNSENKTANLSLSNRYDYIKKEGGGGGKLDFSYTGIPNKYSGASQDPLRNPSPMIFLVDGVAHNHMNFGNFLFGAAGKAMDFTGLELKLGAQWNSLKNSDKNGYAPQFDSSDDQFSIGCGVDYAKDNNYQNMEYEVEVGPITPGTVVP